MNSMCALPLPLSLGAAAALCCALSAGLRKRDSNRARFSHCIHSQSAWLNVKQAKNSNGGVYVTVIMAFIMCRVHERDSCSAVYAVCASGQRNQSRTQTKRKTTTQTRRSSVCNETVFSIRASAKFSQLRQRRDRADPSPPTALLHSYPTLPIVPFLAASNDARSASDCGRDSDRVGRQRQRSPCLIVKRLHLICCKKNV